MEVHAHSHTARKKWTHYFWEFLMLFLAVFCGFLAENLREHQIEHKRTVHYADQFINEIELDTAQISEGVSFVNGKKKEVDSLIRALNNQSWKDIYFWGLHIEEYYVAKFHSASFEQIKYAGYLRNFKNEELVNSIQDYINYRDNVEIVQTELAAFYNQQLTPFINRSLDKQYLAENNVRKRPVFDSLWNKKPINASAINLIEFRNMLITIRDSYYLDLLYKMLNQKSTVLISQLKKEFHLK